MEAVTACVVAVTGKLELGIELGDVPPGRTS